MSTAVSLKYPVVKFQATVTSIRESQLVYRELHPTSIIAFLNSNKTEKLSPSSQSDENKKCAYCNRRGHLRESCFSWLEKKTPDGSKWSTKNPKKAAKKHKLKEKSSRRRGEAKKNSRNNSSINTRIVDDTKHGAWKIDNYALISGGNKKGNDIIFDTGASNHAFCDKSLFVSMINFQKLMIIYAYFP